MKKFISAVLLHVLLLPAPKAQTTAKFFDQQVQLKSCHISIKANYFIATTFIEMEFYNPKEVEVEGLQVFRLNKGQVVTAFQLELDGKYRDGSIEEKWKANRAYSSIVGKRIDPAILQMGYDNYYTLRIYPIPAHSSRKVTMTIDQLMNENNNGKLSYLFPLNFSSGTSLFTININVDIKGCLPEMDQGIFKGSSFTVNEGGAIFRNQRQDIKLNDVISFLIPVPAGTPQLCISNNNGINEFVLRPFHIRPEFYEQVPASLSVFWDVSASARNRNSKKELEFLGTFIRENDIKIVTITLFNQSIQNVIYYDNHVSDFNMFKNYLAKYEYKGATSFSNIDLAKIKADAILIFSDGYNSFGSGKPSIATVPVSCIASSPLYNRKYLQEIVSLTGGTVINLYDSSVAYAVKKMGQARNFILGCKANGLQLNNKLPKALTGNIILAGTYSGNGPVVLELGNSATEKEYKEISLSTGTCDNELYRKVKMLQTYDSIIANWRWNDMLVFGLTEKIVTPYTSFLVLERIEDYIKYNIAPPRELEAACAERNYVYKTEYRIRQIKAITEQDALATAVKEYNVYVKWWDANESLINLDKVIEAPVEINTVANSNGQPSNNPTPDQNNREGTRSNSSIKEVIVTSAYNIKRTVRSVSSNVQVLTSDQLNPVRNTSINDALAGKVSGIQVRSQSSAALGRQNNVRLNGENTNAVNASVLYVVNGTILPNANDINIDDIEDVTVLSGPSAAALFGPEGANGAIVMTLKRFRYYYGNYPVWSEYKLSASEDADYIQKINAAERSELKEVYLSLAEDYGNSVIFYYDMAEIFFAKGFKKEAGEILYEGMEACNGSSNALRAAAFILESWKDYKKSIQVYSGILEQSPANLPVMRDLALAYFQNGNYQQAVDTYYKIIGNTTEGSDDGIKAIALNEMNAVIALYGDSVNLGTMNLNLLKQLPVDLKITIESNDESFGSISVTDPSGKICSDAESNNQPGAYMGNSESNYWRRSTVEYSTKHALKGSYKIKVNSYNRYNWSRSPSYIRIIAFKNFQKPNQSIEVQHVVMDNQYGLVEISGVKW